MFILLWMYLGGLICLLTSLVKVAIMDHYSLRKTILVIIGSFMWPTAYLADLISLIIYAIRRNKN